MNYKQCRNVFPSYDEFRDIRKNLVRLHCVALIPKEHLILLSKMSEICGDEWPLDLLQWMYLVHDDRGGLMHGYCQIIQDAVFGEIEIGTRKESFENRGDD
jgi:hypothetical protein